MNMLESNINIMFKLIQKM